MIVVIFVVRPPEKYSFKTHAALMKILYVRGTHSGFRYIIDMWYHSVHMGDCEFLLSDPLKNIRLKRMRHL